jgi:hypothetical protein
VTRARYTLGKSTLIVASACCLLATTIAKTRGMYGKAVKSRHCPATVCAFAAGSPFCKKRSEQRLTVTYHWIG